MAMAGDAQALTPPAYGTRPIALLSTESASPTAVRITLRACHVAGSAREKEISSVEAVAGTRRIDRSTFDRLD